MQNLSECWSSVRDKVEFAEHGKVESLYSVPSNLTDSAAGEAGSGHTICAVLIAGLSLLLGKLNTLTPQI